ncbi:hypothetical protein F1880_001710 [Penicillium rolfsii]|nr:hypothetical protein F1880_001710 [Penicillium rolfsii]
MDGMVMLYGRDIISIGADVENDIIDSSSNKTVLEVIKEGALSYRVSSPEEYFKGIAELTAPTSYFDPPA